MPGQQPAKQPKQPTGDHNIFRWVLPYKFYLIFSVPRSFRNPFSVAKELHLMCTLARSLCWHNCTTHSGGRGWGAVRVRARWSLFRVESPLCHISKDITMQIDPGNWVTGTAFGRSALSEHYRDEDRNAGRTIWVGLNAKIQWVQQGLNNRFLTSKEAYENCRYWKLWFYINKSNQIQNSKRSINIAATIRPFYGFKDTKSKDKNKKF